MKVIVQRVKSAKVTVKGRVINRIAKGMLILVGIAKKDATRDADLMATRIANLRVLVMRTKR